MKPEYGYLYVAPVESATLVIKLLLILDYVE